MTGRRHRGIARAVSHRRPALIAVVVACLLVLSSAAVAAPGPADVRETVQTIGVQEGRLVLEEMAAGQVPGTGVALWLDPRPGCSWCATGPAVAAAALAARTRDPWFARVATRTVDATLEAAGPPEAAGVETAFLAAGLGTTAVLLGDDLDEAHRRRWTALVQRAALALDRNGDDQWYANGNVALANVLVFLTAARLTGQPRWAAAYRRSLAFTVSPDRRFPGRGLVVTRPATEDDAGDGAGYLTEEQPPGAPGFDPQYSLVQLGLLVQLDVVSGGDRTVRRLLNLVTNQLRPRIDVTDWTVDLAGGSRRPEPEVWSLSNGAWPYLASRGRDDLAGLAPEAAAAIMADLRKNALKDQPALRLAMGGMVAGLVS